MPETDLFPTQYDAIIDRLEQIDPEAYSRSRNFLNGAVTRLSPYISRGVLSTRQVMQSLERRGFEPLKIEKFVQELAWRDYWQQVWIAKGAAIDSDLKSTQMPVAHHKMPRAIADASTGIDAIDKAIRDFYDTGYLHNHVRMYLACIACNIGQAHWNAPARWMYYHLLDADWASNVLSWQWVAGSNSSKKYYANQENINKYCFSKQTGTFLDVDYSAFNGMDIPAVLRPTTPTELVTPLPASSLFKIDATLPTLIYNFYNLDPLWHAETPANRILLLEPSLFSSYPVSEKSISFALALASNIPGIQLFTGEFSELTRQYHLHNIHFKEHPLNGHYRGTEEPRDWMFGVKGYFPSFFAFWKKCRKELERD